MSNLQSGKFLIKALNKMLVIHIWMKNNTLVWTRALAIRNNNELFSATLEIIFNILVLQETFNDLKKKGGKINEKTLSVKVQ